MVTLPKTAEALAAFDANHKLGFGEHLDPRIMVGSTGLQLGHVPYDPIRHDPLHIDRMSIMSLATGEDHVRNVKPQRPFILNVITDYGFGEADMQHIAEQKGRLATALHEAVDTALPGMTDKLFAYSISDTGALRMPSGTERLQADPDNVKAIQREIEDIAQGGLTFVIGGFRRIIVPDVAENVVAVKVNQAAERFMPANIGRVSLGGSEELDTNNPEQVRWANRQLDGIHRGIVLSLRNRGASVASVVTDSKSPQGYDARQADAAISAAITEKQ